ncbi:hypothetical protein, partial [Leptospira noguchii]|uniref:hypothetical protein n=1 Tax=Leptospira noguchii TaxID=28182 RepID=UPI001E556AE3
EFGVTNAKAIIMLRSIVSSIEFEKFRRNWSENELSTTLSYGARWKLSVSLPMGRSTGRVNSAKRFLRKRFRVNKLNLKTIVVLCFLYAIY